jgi:site-specific DNA-methyltransferase (adenine-specific)
MKLINGDFRELLPCLDRKADLVFADLPYGKVKDPLDVMIPFEDVWEAIESVSHDKTIVVCTAVQPFTSMLLMSNLKMFRYEIIWTKNAGTDFLNAKRKPLNAHESILVFYKKFSAYNPQKTAGHARKVSSAHHKRNSVKTINFGEHAAMGYDSTERYPTTVWNFASDKQKSALHNNQKPVSLMERIVKSYSTERSLVIDPCMGSGSTGIACLNTGRDFIGIEKDPKRFGDAKDRINNHKP